MEIAMNEFNREEIQCDSLSLDVLKYKRTKLGSIFVGLNSSKENIEYFIVNSLYTDRHWVISTYEPKYYYIYGSQMTQEEKEELMHIFNNGGWEELINLYDYGCEDGCWDDRLTCYHYTHRKPFPKTPPDYMQL